MPVTRFFVFFANFQTIAALTVMLYLAPCPSTNSIVRIASGIASCLCGRPTGVGNAAHIADRSSW